jgi:hypothetical protein
VPVSRTFAAKYSRRLLQTIDWCLELDHMKRPQSVFALQKVLLGEKEPEVHGRVSLRESLRGSMRLAWAKLAGRGSRS